MKKAYKKSGINATKRHKFSGYFFRTNSTKKMPENLWRLVRIKAQNAYALRNINAQIGGLRPASLADSCVNVS